jgi:hypothetical protein
MSRIGLLERTYWFGAYERAVVVVVGVGVNLRTGPNPISTCENTCQLRVLKSDLNDYIDSMIRRSGTK